MFAAWNFTSKFEINSDCKEYVLNFCACFKQNHQFLILFWETNWKKPNIFCKQSRVLQSLWLWWSRQKETARWRGTRYLTQTAMRPLSKKVMAVRQPATPPATTAHISASVATPTWCLCWRTTWLAAVLRGRFSTTLPVSSSANSYTIKQQQKLG